MKAEPFENVKNQIGFCGIWCGSCPGGNGVTIELTRRYEEFVRKRARALEKWAPKDFDLKEFMNGLASIQKMSSCPGCLKGGGDPTCSIRLCASKKNIVDCRQCGQLMACEKFEMLEKSHPMIKEDLAKIKNVDRQDLVEKWMSELRNKWPHCILLCPSTNDDKSGT